jgi:hypothetical protein
VLSSFGYFGRFNLFLESNWNVKIRPQISKTNQGIYNLIDLHEEDVIMVICLRGFVIQILWHCLSTRDLNPLSRGYLSSFLPLCCLPLLTWLINFVFWCFFCKVLFNLFLFVLPSLDNKMFFSFFFSSHAHLKALVSKTIGKQTICRTATFPCSFFRPGLPARGSSLRILQFGRTEPDHPLLVILVLRLS